MVNSIGGRSNSLINLYRQGALRRNSESSSEKTGSTSNLKKSHSLNDLTQIDTPSPVGGTSPLNINTGETRTTQGLSSLTLLQKKGEPSLELIQEMQPFAVASKSIYSNFDDPLPKGWSHLLPTEGTLATFRAAIPDLSIDKKGHLSTPNGLVAGIFLTENKEVCLAFGGTTSGEVTGDSKVERSIAKLGLSGRQWIANAKNALTGTKPTIYKQAATLAEMVSSAKLNSFTNVEGADEEQTSVLMQAQELESSSQNSEKKLIITGHSLGGGLAQYSAITVGTPDKPVSCYGFCSAELGKSIQKEISDKCGGDQEKINDLVSGIKNLKIKGDVVPNMHNLFSVSAVGESYTILPTAEAVGKGMPDAIDYHTNYVNHIAHFTASKTGSLVKSF